MLFLLISSLVFLIKRLPDGFRMLSGDRERVHRKQNEFLWWWTDCLVTPSVFDLQIFGFSVFFPTPLWFYKRPLYCHLATPFKFTFWIPGKLVVFFMVIFVLFLCISRKCKMKSVRANRKIFEYSRSHAFSV